MSYEVEQTDWWAEQEAGRKGCYVVYPRSDQLQLDLDSDAAYAEFERRLTDFMVWGKPGNIPLIEVRPSKSGLPHRHVTLTLPGADMPVLERIALQVLLGSDPVREKMNVLRVLRGISQPVRFFEPKVEGA